MRSPNPYSKFNIATFAVEGSVMADVSIALETKKSSSFTTMFIALDRTALALKGTIFNDALFEPMRRDYHRQPSDDVVPGRVSWIGNPIIQVDQYG